jgi:uncharacterized RDD family membrane protein YckC
MAVASTDKPFCQRCALRQLWRVRATQVCTYEGARISVCDSCADAAADGTFESAGIGAYGWPVWCIVTKDGRLIVDPRERR